MTLASRRGVFLAWALLSGSGCSLDGLGGSIGKDLACAVDFDLAADTESDNGQLEAMVDCEPDVDCADVRTVAVGASFGLVITTGPQSERRYEASELRAESSNPRVLELKGFAQPDETCDGYELPGRATFIEAGTAALIIYRGDEEIDRFTATASEVVSADVQETFSFFGGGDWTPVGDRIVVDGMHLHRVRVIARNASDDRLIGAKAASITVDDPQLVDVGAGPSSVLIPQQLGTTTLRAMVAGVEASVPLEVVGLPSPDAGPLDFLGDDAGVDAQ